MAFFSAASYIYLVLTSFKVWREKNRRRKLTKRKLIVQILSFEPKLSTMKFTYVPKNSSNTTMRKISLGRNLVEHAFFLLFQRKSQV